ncbi:MAG: lipopolysaccharide biosynthesis protein [Lachnospiraceae bacterium]|nr:lipopolysaccharide biosynthesis protein [Lachnospiraceae bacterium]MCI9398227.1 lipopolysaccharide biosynthesis protein [Lachnospiraceae bacterium]
MKGDKVVSGFLWRFMERFGAYAVSFVVSVILARILDPEAYGTIALVTVFTNILQVFVESGLGRALVQKKEAEDIDFSSVFYFNMAVCLLLYCGLFAFAPYIAQFFNNIELTSVIRVLGIILIISGLKNVQQAYVSRKMLFKKFFYATLIGTLFSAVVGICLAYWGAGVWALVAQSLANALVDTLMLWITVKWRPKKCFSLQRLKGLLSYGWKLLIAALVGSLSDNLRQLFIGKLYTSADLAFYNKGDQIPSIVNGNVNAAIDSVIFPVMAEAQDNKESVKNMTRRAITTSTYIMAPIYIGLACCAETLIRILLTEKWLPCVPFLRIFCITYLFYPIHTANLNAILAVGRSDIDLKLELIKKLLEIMVLLLTMRYGVMAIAYGLIGTAILNQIINAWPNKELIGYSYLEQIRDVLPEIALACVMGAVVYFVGYLQLPDLTVLVLQIMVGIVVYLGLSALMRLEAFIYLLGKIKGRRK